MGKKIKISITVEVDVDEWAAEYGLAASEVREDVRSWLHTAVNGAELPIMAVK